MTTTLEQLLLNIQTLRPRAGEVLVVTLPADASREAVAATVGSLKANAGTYPCPTMVVVEGTQVFTHPDVIRKGDRLAISTELLEAIHTRPGHVSQTVVITEVRQDPRGVKIALVRAVGEATAAPHVGTELGAPGGIQKFE